MAGRQPAQVPQIFGKTGGGRSGPVAALLNVQQSQQEQVSKLIEAMELAQKENALAVQQAAQAGGGAATQVANQVTRGLREQEHQTRRQQERAEDKAFAVQQQELNAELQAKAGKEAALMGASIKANRDNMLAAHESFNAKKSKMNEAIEALDARTDEMLAAGHFDSKSGRKELVKRRHLYRMAKNMHDDHFDDRHVRAMYKLHNDNLEARIKGDATMDLSGLQVEPMLMPMVQLSGGKGSRVANVGEISPEMMFKLKMTGGYPPNGVLFSNEENFGLAEGYVPKLTNARTMLNAAADDDEMRFVMDKSLRQELRRKKANLLAKSTDAIKPLLETYGHFNDVFSKQAGGAIERSMESFLADPNPNKFNDMDRQLVLGALVEIFGGGKKGEEIAIIAGEVFDGKRELKSDKEITIAMALESAFFNIEQQMQGEWLAVGEGGESFAGALAKQMVDELGEDAAAAALGVQPGAVGLVKMRDVLVGRLGGATSLANRYHKGFEKTSILEQLIEQNGDVARRADIMSYQVLNEGEANERRVRKLLGTGEILERSEERVEGLGALDVEGRLKEVGGVDLEETITAVEAATGIAQDLGFDTINAVGAMITNELEPFTTPDFNNYIQQTRVEAERSGYARNLINEGSFNYNRQQRAKKKRLSEQPGVGESFEKGGAVGVVTEQAPIMLGLGVDLARRGIEQAAVIATMGVAGKEAATSTLRGLRIAERGLAEGVARVATDSSAPLRDITRRLEAQQDRDLEPGGQ